MWQPPLDFGHVHCPPLALLQESYRTLAVWWQGPHGSAVGGCPGARWFACRVSWPLLRDLGLIQKWLGRCPHAVLYFLSLEPQWQGVLGPIHLDLFCPTFPPPIRNTCNDHIKSRPQGASVSVPRRRRLPLRLHCCPCSFERGSLTVSSCHWSEG